MSRLLPVTAFGVFFFLSSGMLAGEAHEKKAFIEIPCQGQWLWVAPVSLGPSPNLLVQFTTSWNSTKSFVFVDDRYAQNIEPARWEDHELYSGHFVVDEDVTSFTIDGCYVPLESKQ